MKSRLDRYDNVNAASRVSKNQNLYDDIYSNTNYTNMVVIDDSNEIDISKIKEIIDNSKGQNKRIERNNFNKEEYDNLTNTSIEEKKLYDINEVLKEAKNQRNIMEEANEKRKIQNYKFRENLDEELSKTRKVYENLIKEEKELLNIMNTMTNVSSDDLALDMFSDLTKDEGLTEVLEEVKTDVNIKQIENDDTTEYSTDTFMFNTKDFDSIEDLREDVEKTSVFIKILIFIITVVIITGIGFLVYTFFIK